MSMLMFPFMLFLLIQSPRMPLIRNNTVPIDMFLVITVPVLGHSMLIVRHILHSNPHKIDIILNLNSFLQ